MNGSKTLIRSRVLSVILSFVTVFSTLLTAFAVEGVKVNAAESTDGYVSLFWGEAESADWGQAVDVATTRSGGEFDAANITEGGHFYVEYSGTEGEVELILQSYGGGVSWAKVSPSEKGYANDHYYAKYSYENCVSAFGTDDFSGELDKIFVGATRQYVKVYSLCYDFGDVASGDSDSSSSNNGGASDSGSLDSGSSSSGNASSIGGFYVDGTKVRDANGNEFVMRGINVAHAWFTDYTETSLEAIAATGANTVRVVLSDGEVYTKTTASELESIIELCKRNNLVCIVEIHDATGSDSTSSLNKAVNYWIEMKDILNKNKQYVIVNIANEWYGTWDGSAWAEGNKAAIKSLRDAGIGNMLIVDSAGWGQYPDSIKNYGKSVFQADELGNTIFSIHMYEYAGGNSSMVKSNIDKALGINVPVIIGEFGCKHTDGDVDEYTIMSYCKEKQVGYLGWSWKGNGSAWAYLDLANEWDGSSLSDWGETLIYDTNGIKNTSKICSVYADGIKGEDSNNNESSGDESSGEGPADNDSSGGSASDNDSLEGSSSVSIFEGKETVSSWCQAVSILTAKNYGSMNASDITSDGYFYVEYTGSEKQIEIILQSWSGGTGWAKVDAYEYGLADGYYYAKFSYNDCVKSLGTNDFANKLDQFHVGAKEGGITVYSVDYCY